MSTRQAIQGHPTHLFILSSPPLNSYRNNGKVSLWYFTKLREAVWGVLNGDGNGFAHLDNALVFGRLTYLQDGPSVDLTPLVEDCFREHVLELKAAGIESYREWSLPLARSLEGPEKKAYEKIRKASADALEQRLEQALQAAGV